MLIRYSVRFGEASGVVSCCVCGGRGGVVLVFSGLFLLCSVDYWVVAVIRLCSGFLSFGCCFRALSEWSFINSVRGIGCCFGFGSPGGGEVGFFLRGPAAFGFLFGGGAFVAAGCKHVGISVFCCFFFFNWLAVELWLEEEYDLNTHYLQVYISCVLGVVWVFHSPGGSDWGHFCPEDIRTGLHSFWAGGAWLVGIWSMVEE